VAILGVSGHFVHVFEVPTEIAALGEGLLAHGAGEGPLSGVLAEVVSQIATLLEDASAASVPALEVQLNSLRHLMFHLDGFVPLPRNALERLRVDLGHDDVLVREIGPKAQIGALFVRMLLQCVPRLVLASLLVCFALLFLLVTGCIRHRRLLKLVVCFTNPDYTGALLRQKIERFPRVIALFEPLGEQDALTRLLHGSI